MSKGIVHLAGPVVQLDHRIIQRCLICGQKVLDSQEHKLEAFVMGSNVGVFTYAINSWVEVRENSSSVVGNSFGNAFRVCDLPSNSCIGMIE